MSNVITIELCAEDRARLDAILGALQAGPNCESCVKSAIDFVGNHQNPEAAPDENPTQGVASTASEPIATAKTTAPDPVTDQSTTSDPEPKVERSDIQKKVVELSQAGKKDAVRSIVTAYNNTKVSDIPEDKLPEVLEKLTALEG